MTALLGEGGMGQVYRATDTNLKRQVAIKVLPESVAADRDRLARFQREAEVLAALNHPNIAQIYGLEKSEGITALVMELVEGDDLSQRIARGAIPIEEALPIAKQIAEALEAAHEQGIVHRDPKPANIKVTPAAVVKVLDFGLAKAIAPTASEAPAYLRKTGGENLTQLPTVTSPAAITAAGVILGTAAYMSPEQAQGRPTDKRSDIWAFGCVLYETLTGTRPFQGDDITETLANILKTEPDWSALPVDTPAPIRTLLRRCLQKDRKRRLESASDARLEIEERDTESGADARSSMAASLAIATNRMPWPSLAVAGAGVLALVGSLAVSQWRPRSAEPSPATARRLVAELGADVEIAGTQSLALSPDGSVLAFIGTRSGTTQLYLRPLDQLHATAVSGTRGVSTPFFAPDGRWIAFFADGKLKKVAVTGGAPVTICDAANRGGSWGDDGEIVFMGPATDAVRSPLFRVSSGGGTPKQATTLTDDEVTHRWPQVLPGAKAVLYTAHNRTNNYAEANIVLQVLPNGPRKVLQRGGSFGRYLSSGHLVYIQGGTLFAAPFDLQRMEVTGPGMPALQNVANIINTGGAQIVFGGDGTLVYLQGQTTSGDRPIDWLTRDGKITSLRADPASWTNLRFSPDGTRLAMWRSTPLAAQVLDQLTSLSTTGRGTP